jgi:hypothetical protein
VAHVFVRHLRRVEVDGGELFDDQVEQAVLVELLDLGGEVEALEDVPGGRREGPDVGVEVFAQVILVAEQRLEIQRRGIEEALAGLPQQEGGFRPAAFFAANSASTAALVGSSTQSRRRRTVNGRMTLP